jgi:hypothetical protein
MTLLFSFQVVFNLHLLAADMLQILLLVYVLGISHLLALA